jgi:hypothetical protein
MRVVGNQRHRRTLAVATVLLWLAAVEVLPNLHLAVHDDDHTHAADGTIHAVAAHEHEEHDHGTGPHRHRRPYPRLRAHHGHAHAAPAARRDAPGELAFDEAPVDHAALGMAHRALATLDPPPPLMAPVGAPVATAWTHTFESTPVIITPSARPTARGPPRV